MSLKNVSADTPGTLSERKLWGRRQNRPIKGERETAMQTIFPRIEISADLLTQEKSLDPASLFNTPSPTWLEIGFGGGEHIIGLLDQRSDINMLAAEPFINGMANFVKDLPDEHIPRTRALMDDAMLLVRALKDNTIDRLYILNPDPWHKKRHYKRRIVNPDNLNEFARILKPGGQLIMTSDVPDLADWMVTHTYNHPHFIWSAIQASEWTQAPADWITTRYEVKGAKGARKMCYLHFTCEK